jgi:hypothetical protein
VIKNTKYLSLRRVNIQHSPSSKRCSLTIISVEVHIKSAHVSNHPIRCSPLSTMRVALTFTSREPELPLIRPTAYVDHEQWLWYACLLIHHSLPCNDFLIIQGAKKARGQESCSLQSRCLLFPSACPIIQGAKKARGQESCSLQSRCLLFPSACPFLPVFVLRWL